MEYLGFSIGDTPLFESPELSARYNARVLVKDESQNTVSGTFKDRRNMHVLEQDAGTDCPIYYVQITSGNSANSMGRMAGAFERETGKKRGVVNIVSPDLSIRTRRLLKHYGPVVVRSDVNKRNMPVQEQIEIARKQLKGNVIIKTVERIDGYDGLASELYNECFPSFVFMPVGAAEGFYSLARNSPDSTRVIGATIDENPLASEEVPDIGESPADKLGCVYSPFADLARKQCSNGHEILVVDNDEILGEQEYLNTELGLDVDPNAAVAFAAARKYSDKMTLDDTAVIIKSAGNASRIAGLNKSRRRNRRIAYATAALATLIAAAGVSEYLLDNRPEKGIVATSANQFFKGMTFRNLGRGNEYYNKYVAYAVYAGEGEVNYNVLNILQMYSGGGVDRMIVIDSPNMMKVVNDYDAWRNTQKN